MPETLDIESQGSSGSHRRHKRKRKSRKRMLQKIIVISLFMLVCAGALAAWYFLVQEPPSRTGVPYPGEARLLKA